MNPYIAQMTTTFIDILTWAIIARALLSWFPIDQGSAVYQMLFRVTEPLIDPFRRILPQTGMIDLSPLAAIFALIILSLTFNSLAVIGQ
jgi:YggT family protein